MTAVLPKHASLRLTAEIETHRADPPAGLPRRVPRRLKETAFIARYGGELAMSMTLARMTEAGRRRLFAEVFQGCQIHRQH